MLVGLLHLSILLRTPEGEAEVPLVRSGGLRKSTARPQPRLLRSQTPQSFTKKRDNVRAIIMEIKSNSPQSLPVT